METELASVELTIKDVQSAQFGLQLFMVSALSFTPLSCTQSFMCWLLSCRARLKTVVHKSSYYHPLLDETFPSPHPAGDKHDRSRDGGVRAGITLQSAYLAVIPGNI